MHKDGFTFDSQGVVESGVIVNLRRDENKRFRNGNSRFIFPRRKSPPSLPRIGLESNEHRSSKHTASNFRNLANILLSASRVYLR